MFVDIFFDFSSPLELRQLTTILHNFTTISSPFCHHFTIIVPPIFSIFPHISAQETSAPSSKFQRNPRSPLVRTALRPQQPPGAAAPGGHHWQQALPVASAGDEVLHVRCGGGLCFEVLPVTWMKTWDDLVDTWLIVCFVWWILYGKRRNTKDWWDVYGRRWRATESSGTSGQTEEVWPWRPHIFFAVAPSKLSWVVR